MVEEEREKREHETMVRILVNYLHKNGYSTKVEPDTSIYAGVKADVEAQKGKENLCFEVVNGKKIDAPEIKAKWEAISGNRIYDFCLFVPKEKEAQVKKLLKEWAIYFRKLWLYAPESI